MKSPKMHIFTFVVALGLLANTATAFALQPTVAGKSNGGTAGYANCNGRITVSQGGFFSNDSATAYTSADATGTYAVAAVVWYNDGTSEKTKYEDKIVYNSSAEISVTSTAPNNNGNKATGGHTYSSSIRGSWSGSTEKPYS
ncbi:hypothetical protein PA598K_07139 [Paenibacillus sp. 598K]|uniref:hypothetical protein n=1 Tax=Paenibacillus sp. 598K TaxID=1117987 RepID=UPI000FF9911E|nr:hypothetical protein [Paenibacillus sp. 598K]GBF78488.1 hypothetical protein PA598K_07139 [Paenibacillus sp. 598K]